MGRAMHNSLRQARIDLAAAYRLAVVHGLHEGICNHFTYVPPDLDDRFLLIPHGMHWSEVTASNLLLVGLNGAPIEGEGKAEASAFHIHGRLHQARPDARCVMHTHMPYATALTMIEGGRLEPALQTGLRFDGQIAYDDDYRGVAVDGGEGDRMAQILGDKSVLFLAHHGVIVVERTVALAYDALYYLERACMTQVLAMSTGRPLKHVPAAMAEATAAQFATEAPFAETHFAALKRLLDRDQPDYAA